MLQRIGISLDDNLLLQFDEYINKRGYQNRSEAVRDLIRKQLVNQEWSSPSDDSEKVAVVVLVYDHDSSDLSQRLTSIQHKNHKAVVSALHVHMDAHKCLEVLIIRGNSKEILTMGEALASTKDVKYGKVIPATSGINL